MSRILIAYASSYGQTRKIADAIAADLRNSGHVVELADALASPPPPVQDYDAVVLGSSVQFGHHAKPIRAYITENRAELGQVPSYFFSVSMSAAGSHAPDPDGYLEKLFAATQWHPRQAIAIAGGLPYRKYGFVLRQIMKLISRRGGQATDTRRDHEYTDWAQVGRFSTSIAADLGPPSYPAAPRKAEAPREAGPRAKS
jgi:menaquinone-dependent protoporphyrinogen oxidase